MKYESAEAKLFKNTHRGLKFSRSNQILAYLINLHIKSHLL